MIVPEGFHVRGDRDEHLCPGPRKNARDLWELYVEADHEAHLQPAEVHYEKLVARNEGVALFSPVQLHLPVNLDVSKPPYLGLILLSLVSCCLPMFPPVTVKSLSTGKAKLYNAHFATFDCEVKGPPY